MLGYHGKGDHECTLLEATPVTGRTHQIRVHAQSAGHPLVGDDKYAEDAFNQVMKKKGFKRLFLHAAKITFPLPADEGAKVVMKTVETPLPDDLALPLEKF